MEYTNGNLRLVKPQLSDIPDITKMNPNWDKLDEEVSKIGNLQSLKTNAKDNVVNAINEGVDNTINIGFGKNCKQVTVSDFKQLPQGKWFGTLSGTPTGGVCYYDVRIGDNERYKRVECRPWLTNVSYSNQMVDGTWSGWAEMATTSKTEILLTPKASFTIINQKNVKINNILYINAEIKKTDGTMFTGNQFVNALTMPFSVWNSTLSMIGSYNGFFQVSGSSIGYDTHIALVPTRECEAIRVTGVIVL